VFRVNTDGTGFQTLHSFTAVSNYTYLNFITATNSDGAGPNGGLLLSGNTLYGTADTSGPLGWGTAFALNPNGTGFQTLYAFGPQPPYNSVGANPSGGLVLLGNRLYGTAIYGGNALPPWLESLNDAGSGTVFAINTDGTGFTVLHSFPTNTVNSDGIWPYAQLIIDGNTLYGATSAGAEGNGTVFAMNMQASLGLRGPLP
jgi:uncharacterized repeat protein (TIGR03803 family)